MPAPSIKGTAFQSVAADLQKLIDAGRIPRNLLEARLRPEDRRLLESPVLPGQWVPLASYERLVELLLRTEGAGQPDYLVRRGARAAERLFAAGLYLQLERGEAIGAQKRELGERWTATEGNLLASLSGAIFSVSSWRFRVDPEEASLFYIDVSEAEALPEVSRLSAQGFIEYAASRIAGRPMQVTSERPERDRIRFTLRRSKR